MPSSDNATRPYDFNDYDATTNDALATDELELPRPSRQPFARTRALPAYSEEPTQRFERTERFAATQRFEPVPAPAPRQRVAAASAAQPVVPAPAAPVAVPYHPAAAAAAYRAPSLDAGPDALARLGSILVCAVLMGVACVLLFLGVTGALASAAGVVSGQAFDPAITVWTFAGAVLTTFLAMLTARWSGMGVGLVGLTLLTAGVLTIVFPNAAMDLLEQQVATPQDPTGGLLGGIIDDTMRTVLQSVSAVLGGVALLLGSLFFGAGLAVHGARGAGWRRGIGRY
ncbi:hypothetical protein M3D15_05430 [Pseudoclavibacter alba]|uniref:Uncharacterized protein n=1 Tax=Pseudoclavibacter albus TaxID=272241 RepID=A0ABT2HWU0_9MICO|nr:hypothetical protein [Pseudoclavibacter alba]MCT2042775.1 hypothetical protein [Pseudoclavibacter alba]